MHASIFLSTTLFLFFLTLSFTSARSAPSVEFLQNFRRDDSFISPDPALFSVSGNCDYVWTSMLSTDDGTSRIYTSDGLGIDNVMSGAVNDFALGAAAVGLLVYDEWQPQIWSWVDETSGNTVVRVDLQGPWGVVIMSDRLPLAQNDNSGCFQYFGYATPNGDSDEQILYVALLEKALAIANGGSYDALNGMSANDAFLALTGQPGKVIEAKVGSENQDVLTAITDAIENKQPCVVEFILPSDLTSFDSWDPDSQEVKLDIGTLWGAQWTTEFSSDSGNYFYQGQPILYTSFHADDDKVYFYNVGMFDVGRDDPEYGLILPKELLLYAVKTVTTWTSGDGDGNIARSTPSWKRAATLVDPIRPDPSLIRKACSTKCNYVYQDPPSSIPLYNQNAVTKDNVDQGCLPECPIGAASLALMEAKQFLPEIAKSNDPLAIMSGPTIYGYFYTDVKGTKKRVETSTKLLIDQHCPNPYLGYQPSGKLPVTYFSYLEKLLAAFLDENETLRPPALKDKKGYNGIANIPSESVLQRMTGRPVGRLPRQDGATYFDGFSSKAIALLSPSSQGSSAPKTAVVFGTMNQKQVPPTWKKQVIKTGQKTLTVYTLPYKSTKATVTVETCTTQLHQGETWKISVPGQTDVRLFAHHAYAVYSYDPTTSMFTIANPYPWNYTPDCEDDNHAELQIHRSAMDIFGLELDWVMPPP